MSSTSDHSRHIILSSPDIKVEVSPLKDKYFANYDKKRAPVILKNSNTKRIIIHWDSHLP